MNLQHCKRWLQKYQRYRIFLSFCFVIVNKFKSFRNLFFKSAKYKTQALDKFEYIALLFNNINTLSNKIIVDKIFHFFGHLKILNKINAFFALQIK